MLIKVRKATLPTEEPTEAPSTAAPSTAAPTPLSCETGEILVTASLEYSSDNSDSMEEVEISLIDTVADEKIDFVLDSITTSFSKCVDNRLLTLVVEGDGSKYELKIQSDNAKENTLSLADYNNNYYYHPAVGIIQETTMITCEIPAESLSEVMVLRIVNGSCVHEGKMVDGTPDFSGPTLDFNELTNLIYLSIEDDNQFQAQNTFDLTGLQYLEGVKIGQNCFNYEKNTTPKSKFNKRTFQIKNCPKLSEIQIGSYSFSDFSGGFTLSELIVLRNLYIGEIKKPSFNFYRSQSFSLKSNFAFMLLVIRPSLSANGVVW